MQSELNGVKIGDKFIPPQNRQSKRVCTVIDFYETKSMKTGEVIRHECIYESEILGQKIVNIVPFATVMRNKIDNQ